MEKKYVVVFKVGFDDSKFNNHQYLATDGKWHSMDSEAKPGLLSEKEIEQSEMLNLSMCMSIDEFEVMKIMEPDEMKAFEIGKHKI